MARMKAIPMRGRLTGKRISGCIWAGAGKKWQRKENYFQLEDSKLVFADLEFANAEQELITLEDRGHRSAFRTLSTVAASVEAVGRRRARWRGVQRSPAARPFIGLPPRLRTSRARSRSSRTLASRACSALSSPAATSSPTTTSNVRAAFFATRTSVPGMEGRYFEVRKNAPPADQ